MVSFKSVVLAVVLASADASWLRSRSLSEWLIAGYEPKTDVSDHKNIDLDQQKIEEYLEGGTIQAFSNARKVYEQGGFSKSVATVRLASPLTAATSKGAGVTGGKNSAGSEVSLKAYADTALGVSEIELQYVSGGCNVGGLVGPDTADQNWSGCLAETGSITIDGSTYTYTYSIPTDNTNGRTIAGFSTSAETRMRPDQGTQPFFPDFQKFVNYYGSPAYANEFVVAAFEGRSTNFQKGNADFSIWSSDYVARAEAVKKGSAYIAVMMYAIRELEDALYDCEQGCDRDDCNDDAVSALDEAVAFYAGGLEGTDGSGDGVLMYSLADKRAANFKTAGRNGGEISGKSKVNYDIFQQFSLMMDNLTKKDCSAARSNKERIAQLMFVPLVQGTLRYASIISTDPEADGEARAEGATFAAAVLPVVHACNSQDADTIYENMKAAQNGTPNFSAVKSAFEDNYGCMGITCADVGGVWNDAAGTYETGAEPCGGAGSTSSSSSSEGSSDGSGVNVGLAVGLTVAGLVLVLLVVLYCKKCRKNKSEVEFKSDQTPVA